MKFELPELPFAADALEPYMSRDTLYYHHDEHHRGYLDKLDATLTEELRALELEEIVRQAEEPSLFNPAAQAWNHDFFWQSLTPEKPRLEDAQLREQVEKSFASLEKFHETFAQVAAAEFGSGWAWLVRNPRSDQLEIMSTTDARTPLTMGLEPLVTLDVWEHAYYLDYKHDRTAYIEAFLKHMINWDFAARNLAKAIASS